MVCNFDHFDNDFLCRWEYRPRLTTVHLFFTTVSTSNKTILSARYMLCDTCCVTHWREQCCLSSYRQRQIDQSDCDITANCDKKKWKNKYISPRKKLEKNWGHVQICEWSFFLVHTPCRRRVAFLKSSNFLAGDETLMLQSSQWKWAQARCHFVIFILSHFYCI